MLCGTDPFPEHFRAKKYKIHDHFLTKQDFFHMMKNLPEKVSDEDIEEMFEFADANGDGKISYEEFQIMINPPKPKEIPRPKLSDYQLQEKKEIKIVKNQTKPLIKTIPEEVKKAAKTMTGKDNKHNADGNKMENENRNETDHPQLLSKENIKIHNNITKDIPFKTSKQ